MNDKTKLRELHFKYWIGILCTVIIFTATWKLSATQLVVDQISFAATLASLILAVIAIIYSIVSNQAASLTLGKLESATSIIDAVAARVEAANVTLEQKMDEVPSLMANSLGELHPLILEVSKKVDTTQTILNDRLQSFLIEAPNTDNTPNELQTSLGDHEFDVERFIRRSSLLGKMLMYACILAKKHNVKIDQQKLKEIIPILSLDYSTAFLVAINAADLITHKRSKRKTDHYTLSIVSIHPTVEKIVEPNLIIKAIEKMDISTETKATFSSYVPRIETHLLDQISNPSD